MITGNFVPAAAVGQLETAKNIRIDKIPYPGAALTWNMNVKLFPTDSLKVRQALNYGINRDEYVNTIYKGSSRRACAPLAAGMLDERSLCDYYPYNPSKAAQLLEEDGWKKGPDGLWQKNGQKLTVVLNAPNVGGGNPPEFELLQGQLISLGVDTKIKSQAIPPWYEDNYHCTTNGTIVKLIITDMDTLFAQFSSETVGSNFNFSCYSNPKVDQLLKQRRAESDPAKRRTIYLQIQRTLLDEAVVVPLVDQFQLWLTRNDVMGAKYSFATYPMLSDVSIGK
jgi:peptide/nickel transport system substrate-binding protein